MLKVCAEYQMAILSRSEDAASVTREELYRLVWDQPMIHIAAGFGISGNGLAKACRKLDVPYPPRGYWARLAVGKAPPATPLPPQRPSSPNEVTIRRTPSASDAGPSNPWREAFDEARERHAKIKVPERLAQPHPLIAEWLSEKRRRQEAARHERDPWRREFLHEPDLTPSERRQHRLLHALFQALEQEGGKVIQSDRRALHYARDGEKIAFQLREKLRQEKRPLTESEKEWNFSPGKDWRHELVPTGKVVFAFKTWLPAGLRQDWLETDTKPMETLLPGVVATFCAAIPALAARRRERAEAAQRWEDAARRRREEERARLLNEARWRQFVALAGAAREADLARAFLAKLKASAARESEGQVVAEWIAWAEAELAARDPLGASVAEVLGSLERVDRPGG